MQEWGAASLLSRLQQDTPELINLNQYLHSKSLVMANFNDLAVELQEAIWELVLPRRGVHWFQVEGLLHPAPYVRDTIRFTREYNFGDCTPQTLADILCVRGQVPGHMERMSQKSDNTGGFFRRLLVTVPSVWGLSGLDDNEHQDQAEEVAYLRRCRQLSTYTQITVLLSACRLSRLVALRHVEKKREYSWHLFRGMGPLYRPRPMNVWESQFGGENVPDMPDTMVVRGCEWELLPPRIHMLDLAVFRLHDSQGRATETLRHGPWQYAIEHAMYDTTYANFNRVAIEWHPQWGTPGGREDFCAGNVEALIQIMECRPRSSRHLYWLVDGIPRPDWKHDYPLVVEAVFEEAIADNHLNKYFLGQWKGLGGDDDQRALADLHLNQEFEANGRRYYVVFVLGPGFDRPVRQRLDDAGLGHDGPFPGGEDIWPEALRAPVRFASDICYTGNLGTLPNLSYILSWESI